jgi:hypothetical protein
LPLVLMALVVLCGAIAVVTAQLTQSGLSPLQSRIVSIAESQVGYRTDPAQTYCNKFSAYWHVGRDTCGNANRSEQWCADFAAWVWKTAGAPVTYELKPGDINSASASIYLWGVAHGTWHPVGTGYVPEPGDIAVYGLNTDTLVAIHVAVVTGFETGSRGPDVVNGDGDRTGFSVVESGRDEYQADTARGSESRISGYVSPIQVGEHDG